MLNSVKMLLKNFNIINLRTTSFISNMRQLAWWLNNKFKWRNTKSKKNLKMKNKFLRLFMLKILTLKLKIHLYINFSKRLVHLSMQELLNPSRENLWVMVLLNSKRDKMLKNLWKISKTTFLTAIKLLFQCLKRKSKILKKLKQ